MPRLKVMTLNLGGFQGDWPVRRNHLLQVMQDEEIDVVLLQEVDEKIWRVNQAVEIARMTGYAMAFVPAQRFLARPFSAKGLAILSRFPLSNMLVAEIFSPSVIFSNKPDERRIAQRVELSLDGMSVVLYNTMFPQNPADRLYAAYRLWANMLQEESVLVVVGGDLKGLPEEPAIQFLLGKERHEGIYGELTDAWSIAGIGEAETFPSSSPHMRIDYIFYQAEPTVIVQESKVIGRHPDEMSDHAALLTTFAISTARDQETPFVEEPIGSLEPTRGGFFFDQ